MFVILYDVADSDKDHFKHEIVCLLVVSKSINGILIMSLGDISLLKCHCLDTCVLKQLAAC